MIDPSNDADLLALELAAGAASAANGACRVCDEALDPHDPKWAGTGTARDADSIAACYGTPHEDDPTMHRNCYDELWRNR